MVSAGGDLAPASVAARAELPTTGPMGTLGRQYSVGPFIRAGTPNTTSAATSPLFSGRSLA